MDFIKKIGRIFSIILFSAKLVGVPMQNEKTNRPIDYEALADEVTYLFIREVDEEFGFKCFSTGGSMPSDIEDLNVGFMAYRKATIEEARHLEVVLMEKFLNIINKQKKVRPFLRDYPFTKDRICVSISFYDKKDYPQFEDSISRVFSVRGNIIYKLFNPENCSSAVLAEEKYEEAYQKVRVKLPESSL
ncbi:MAG: hypothetical protein P0S96_00930 [Simkaniaceae bacterium]|nr:hypothetical protein [Candidatus Sacchlamyda saccharinae]